MLKTRLYILVMLLGCMVTAAAQQVRLAGVVVDADSGQPVEFASLRLEETGLWAISDEKGRFSIRNVPTGKVTLTVQSLGYEKRTWPMTVNHDVTNLTLRLHQSNLKLNEVTVVARRKQDEATTSYTISRTALDNQQILNLSDIETLLPGGKTINPTLMSDNRLSHTPRLSAARARYARGVPRRHVHVQQGHMDQKALAVRR